MRSPYLRLLAALGGFLFAGSGAFAAVIIFKDGFVLQGDVKQRATAQVENNQFIPIPTGPFYLDDGARRFRFSHQQVQAVENKGSGRENDVVKLINFIRTSGLTIPNFTGIGSASDWDEHWQRKFTLITDGGRRIRDITQRIDLLTPQIAQVDAVYTYAWSAFYLTDELGPKRVSELLRTHPSLMLKGDKNDAVKRFRIYRFLAQAGWYDLAEKELDSIRKEMPDEKGKVAEAGERLKKLRALQDYDSLELAYRAGRHRWATEQLPRILTEPLDENQKTDLHVLQENYQKAAESLRNVQRLLKELPPEAAEASDRSVLAEAAAAIAVEATIEDFLDDAGQLRRKGTSQKSQRLKTFLQFALQAERDKHAGKKPTQTPAELLALAVTGWLLGGEAAEAKASSAVRLWRARGFVLDYQRARESTTRRRLLEGYERGPKLSPEELAQLIAFLRPPEPAPVADVQELISDVPHSIRQEIHYFVQLPPEYTPSRAYPVLFMLHERHEKPFDALKRWSGPAAQHGYILVAPEWARSPEKAYGSTPQEQAGVLDVLRDLRRRFQVDSDRVFLSGLGDGADMTFDVGLAHPDLFAGLLPVSGDPGGIPTQYWPNAQYLPVYDVIGDRVGDCTKRNIDLFEQRWIVKGFPAVLVEYKGRGREWFSAEVPSMLNWMDRKVRFHAVPELGRSGNGGPLGTEFQTLRQADNHFYWLSTSEIDEHHLSEPRWDSRTSPASLNARITAGNVLIVEARNVRDVTIWLGLDMRDRIDFDKPLLIKVNNAVRWRRQSVPPSMTTLLEDFLERGDRQRLVLAKLSFDGLR